VLRQRVVCVGMSLSPDFFCSHVLAFLGILPSRKHYFCRSIRYPHWHSSCCRLETTTGPPTEISAATVIKRKCLQTLSEADLNFVTEQNVCRYVPKMTLPHRGPNNAGACDARGGEEDSLEKDHP